MKTTLFALFVSASVVFGATYPVSISTTNGRAFGITEVSSLVGKIVTGNVTNAAGSRVAYLSDTNGLGGGGTYTNNGTGIPGTVTGLGISTNDVNLPKLDASTNNFTGDMGVNGTIGVLTATAGSLAVSGPIRMSTNYTAADFIPVTGKATFPMSNAVLYMVTQTKTNLISDGR